MIAVASQKEEETKDQSINQVAYTDINKHDSLSVYRPLVFSSSPFLSTVRHCCISQFFLLHTNFLALHSQLGVCSNPTVMADQPQKVFNEGHICDQIVQGL